MDPYEQQLYKVFDNYDSDCSGLLDRKSLIDLCNTLQLEERGSNLVDSLIKSPDDKVTFSQFRDGLVNVLGAELSNNTHNSSLESPSREVSPKYTYGTKKYGRRSKPNDSSNFPLNTQEEIKIEFTPKSNSCKIQRSHSSNEITDSRKQFKVKKHLSFSDFKKSSPIQASTLKEHSVFLDHSRLINIKESIELCQNICTNKVDNEIVEQIFEDNAGHLDGRITIGEFFHQLNNKLIHSISNEQHKPLQEHSASMQTRLNTMNASAIISIWERAGISKSQQILSDLGFNNIEIDLAELMMVLDEEIRVAIATSAEIPVSQDMTSILLQASLSLHRYELLCLKQEMEQVFAENSKVKNDLSEANQRAALLAQEVDDNHSRMESTLRNRVHQLEQKHNEILKEARENVTQERDATANANTIIKEQEEKIIAMQCDESKLKGQLKNTHEKLESLEKQLCSKNEQFQELEEVKIHLTKEVKLLAKENSELKLINDKDTDEMNKLTQHIEQLQLDNKNLHDRNDELAAEVEKLINACRRRLSLTKPQCDVDISSEQAENETGDTAWDLMMDLRGGVKRRGDSPSKGCTSMFEDESPRIGKLRKCQKISDTLDSTKSSYKTVQSARSYESESEESLGLELLVSQHSYIVKEHGNEPQVTDQIQTKTYILKSLSNIHSILTEVRLQDHNKCNGCHFVKNTLEHLENELNNIEIIMSDDYSNMYLKTDLKSELKRTAHQEDSSVVNELKSSLEKERNKFSEEKAKLTSTIRDLENSLDQLKTEYDKSEEYWLLKLEAEREAFEEEQRQSDERLTELITKIGEYEEQFTPRAGKGSLPTIDEKGSLELQFTELEEEFESFKAKQARELDDKCREIEILKEQLNQLQKNPPKDLKSSQQSPIEYLWNQKAIDSPLIKGETKRDYQNPAFLQKNSESSQLQTDEYQINPIRKPVLPKRCSSAEVLSSPDVAEGKTFDNVWVEEKKTSIPNMIQCSDLEGQMRKNAAQNAQERPANWPSCNPWSVRNETCAGCSLLEQRCRRLQATIIQHQHFAENIQRAARTDKNIMRGKLMNAETLIKDLQQKLTAADLLVKELYVENCQLAADQRMPKVV